MADKNVELVIQQLLEREKKGMNKYGVNTERTDLTAAHWLQHLQEELMDACVYIEVLKRNTPVVRLEVPDDFDIENKPEEGGVDWQIWLQEKKRIDEEVQALGYAVGEDVLEEQPLSQELIDMTKPPPGVGPPIDVEKFKVEK